MNFINNITPGGLEHANRSLAEIEARFKASVKAEEERLSKLPICTVCGQRKDCEPCRVCAQKAYSDAQAYQKRRADDIIRLGGLRAYNSFTFHKYTNKTAIKSCSEYPTKNLFLWGPAGTGKTHLATALARKYPEAVIVKPQHIYRECRGIKPGKEEQKALDRFINIPYLVIDDLGVDKITDFSFSTLYEIIDGRYMGCKTGLIITSNLSLGKLADWLGGDHIPSRISGMCKIIEVTGNDRRATDIHSPSPLPFGGLE